MDKDGTKDGYDLELTAHVSEGVGIPVIASGGAGSCKDFYDALTTGKADAVLAASLFHYSEVSIPELKAFLANRGIPVRRADLYKPTRPEMTGEEQGFFGVCSGE